MKNKRKKGLLGLGGLIGLGVASLIGGLGGAAISANAQRKAAERAQRNQTLANNMSTAMQDSANINQTFNEGQSDEIATMKTNELSTINNPAFKFGGRAKKALGGDEPIIRVPIVEGHDPAFARSSHASVYKQGFPRNMYSIDVEGRQFPEGTVVKQGVNYPGTPGINYDENLNPVIDKSRPAYLRTIRYGSTPEQNDTTYIKRVHRAPYKTNDTQEQIEKEFNQQYYGREKRPERKTKKKVAGGTMLSNIKKKDIFI